MTTLIKRLMRVGTCGSSLSRERARSVRAEQAPIAPRPAALMTDWNSSVLSYDDFR
jgi:hypothetical protein